MPRYSYHAEYTFAFEPGATAMCRSQGVTDEMFETVEEFFSSCGTVSELEESQMNAVISVNGSSPHIFICLQKQCWITLKSKEN